MTIKNALRVTSALALLMGMTACNDNDKDGKSTVVQVAKGEIADGTSETADPILLNDLSFSDGDTTETSTPESI